MYFGDEYSITFYSCFELSVLYRLLSLQKIVFHKIIENVITGFFSKDCLKNILCDIVQNLEWKLS